MHINLQFAQAKNINHDVHFFFYLIEEVLHEVGDADVVEVAMHQQ